jgi:hypothetical protein
MYEKTTISLTGSRGMLSGISMGSLSLAKTMTNSHFRENHTICKQTSLLNILFFTPGQVQFRNSAGTLPKRTQNKIASRSFAGMCRGNPVF